MNTETRFNKFSKGKIECKYRILVPMFSKWKLGIIPVLFFLVCWFGGIIYLVEKSKIGAIVFGLAWPFVGSLIQSVTLLVKQIGTLFFLNDCIKIFLDEEKTETIIRFSELKKIYLIGFVPDGIPVSGSARFKSYEIKFHLKDDKLYSLIVDYDMFLTVNDLNEFSTYPPTLSTTLTTIYQTYRIPVLTKKGNPHPRIC